MKMILISLAIMVLVGCDKDAWENKKADDENNTNNKKNYLTVSEFRERDNETIGYHRISINSNVRGDTEAFMFIIIEHEDPFCDDLNKTITTKGNEEFTWTLCEGYNSAQTSFWIIKDGKRIDLPEIFMEKTMDN
jgi:uncharacterized protein YxeA